MNYYTFGQQVAKKAAVPDISDYLESYNTFDEGHRLDHIQTVQERAKRLAEKYAPKQLPLVDLAAQLHDIGLQRGRKDHELSGAQMVAEDPRFDILGPTQKRLLVNAIKQHRASTGRPRSLMGRIVSDADRTGTELGPALRRAYGYGKANYPDYTKEQHIRRALEHLVEKYGPGGYGRRTYFPETDMELENLSQSAQALLDKNDMATAQKLLQENR